VLFTSPPPARCQPAPTGRERPSVAAARTTSQVVIDGRLDEPDWQRAAVAGGFLQKDPDEGRPATEATEVRILFDDTAIYVGARMFDRDPAAIARRVTRRDGDPEGVSDAIHVGFDPRHDHLTGAVFTVTAAGTQSDAALFNDSWDDDSWDAVWDSAVSIDDRGWIAELRIPLSQLRFETGDGQTWGLHVVRYIQRRAEEDWWALVGKKESGLVSLAGHLTGLDVRGRRHLALLPYTTARGEFIGAVPAGDPFGRSSSVAGGLGLDVKWGITGSLTLDATINPDFGQVEVDPAVVNLTAFETFFEERRPFFLEGADVIDNFGRNGATGYMGFNRSNPTLFYSRRIGRQPQGRAPGEYVDAPTSTTILGAAKLTGKTPGGWSFNLIEATTAREFADTAAGDARGRAEVEPVTNYFVGRLRRDLGQRAGVGVITTAVHRGLRDAALESQLVSQSYLAGVDGHVFLDRGREWVVTSGLSGSYVSGSESAILRLQRSSARYYQRPDASHLELDPSARTMTGWNVQLDFNRNAGNFRPNASLWAVSPGYEVNDLGFQTSADRAGGHLAFAWRKTQPDRFSRFRQLMAAKWYAWNMDRDLIGDGLYTSASVTWPNYWSSGAGVHAGRQVHSDRLTRGGPIMRSPAFLNVFAQVESDERKPVIVSIEGSYSTESGGGWSANGELSLTVRPAPALSVEVGPEWTREFNDAQYVRAVADAAATATSGSRYVFGELSQTEVSMATRVNLLLSPKMSLQVYAQPLLSAGRYATFKEAAAPRTYRFTRYGLDAGSIAYDAVRNLYAVDPASGGGGRPFSFDNPDFNFKSLRVNAVFRWEFRPGSTMYVVWTQDREHTARAGRLELGPDASTLWRAPSDNVLMVKVSYWLSR
jgi:hypothetical protein